MLLKMRELPGILKLLLSRRGSGSKRNRLDLKHSSRRKKDKLRGNDRIDLLNRKSSKELLLNRREC